MIKVIVGFVLITMVQDQYASSWHPDPHIPNGAAKRGSSEDWLRLFYWGNGRPPINLVEERLREGLLPPDGVFSFCHPAESFVYPAGTHEYTVFFMERFFKVKPVVLAYFLKYGVLKINSVTPYCCGILVIGVKDLLSGVLGLFPQIGGVSSSDLEKVEVLLAFGGNPRLCWEELKSVFSAMTRIDRSCMSEEPSTFGDPNVYIDFANLRQLRDLYERYVDNALDYYVIQPLVVRDFIKTVSPVDSFRRDSLQEARLEYEQRKAFLFEGLETPLHIAVRTGNKSMVERFLLIRKKQMEKNQKTLQRKEPKRKESNVKFLEGMAKRMALDTDQDQQDQPAAAVASAPRSSVQDLRERMRAQREGLLRKIDQKRQEDSQQ